MADNKNLDHPDFQGVKGAWNKTLGRQDEDGRGFISVAAGEFLNDTLGVMRLEDEEKGTESALWSPLLHMLVGGVLAVPLGVGTAVTYQLAAPEADPSFKPMPLTQSQQLQEGYSAVTINDYSQWRYVLFVDDGKPQLYRVSSEGDQIEYVAQQQEAHEIMSAVASRLARDHNKVQERLIAEASGSRQSIDFQVTFDTFEQASLPHTTQACAAPCVTRDIVFSDVNHVHDLSTVYAQSSELWAKAAEIALTTNYGFTADQTANLAHDVEGAEAIKSGLLYGMLGGLGLSLSMAGACAVGTAFERTSPTTAVNRRRRKKKQKDATPS
jgi:hypothetical protein